MDKRERDELINVYAREIRDGRSPSLNFAMLKLLAEQAFQLTRIANALENKKGE